MEKTYGEDFRFDDDDRSDEKFSDVWASAVLDGFTEQSAAKVESIVAPVKLSPEALARDRADNAAKEVLKLDCNCSAKQLESEINKLVEALGADEFSVRSAAHTKLQKVGVAALEPLARVYLSTQDSEMRRATERLLLPIVQCFSEARHQYNSLKHIREYSTNYPIFRNELAKVLSGETKMADVNSDSEHARYLIASKSLENLGGTLYNMRKEIAPDIAMERLRKLQEPLVESREARAKLEELFVSSSLTLAARLEREYSAISADGTATAEENDHSKARKVLARALEARPALGSDDNFLTLARKVGADKDLVFRKLFLRLTGKPELPK